MSMQMAKCFFCNAVVEEVVLETPLGDAIADADVKGKVPAESQVFDVQYVNVAL